jgi:hypothetical protein
MKNTSAEFRTFDEAVRKILSVSREAGLARSAAIPTTIPGQHRNRTSPMCASPARHASEICDNPPHRRRSIEASLVAVMLLCFKGNEGQRNLKRRLDADV